MIDTTQNPDKSTAVLTHASGIFAGFIVPLIIWMMNKDNADKQWLSNEAKEALNFQITVAIGLMVSSILMFVLIGVFTFFAVYIANIVLCIMAAIKTNNGEQYRYPLTIRLIK